MTVVNSIVYSARTDCRVEEYFIGARILNNKSSPEEKMRSKFIKTLKGTERSKSATKKGDCG